MQKQTEAKPSEPPATPPGSMGLDTQMQKQTEAKPSEPPTTPPGSMGVGKGTQQTCEPPATPLRCMGVGKSTQEKSSAIGDELPAVLPQADARVSGRLRLLPYEIVGRLGGGSYGDVYKAKPKQNSRVKLPEGVPELFVVKVMSKSLDKAKRTTEQHRELHVLKELAHPNITKLLGWRETHFNFQLLLELASSDLRKHMNKCPLTISAAKTVASHIAAALGYVHSKQILHRDVTSANVLIRSCASQPLAVESAVLADFGCSRKVLPRVEGCNVPMTPDMVTLWYRAPEIFLQSDSYSFSSDMWSYGILMVEMSMGVPPFRHSSEFGMLLSIFKAFGTPSPDLWQGLVGAPAMKGIMGTCPFPKLQPTRPFDIFKGSYGYGFVDLIEGLLQVAPESRMSAEQVLKESLRW